VRLPPSDEASLYLVGVCVNRIGKEYCFTFFALYFSYHCCAPRIRANITHFGRIGKHKMHYYCIILAANRVDMRFAGTLAKARERFEACSTGPQMHRRRGAVYGD
jgi:hypothetical protein